MPLLNVKAAKIVENIIYLSAEDDKGLRIDADKFVNRDIFDRGNSRNFESFSTASRSIICEENGNTTFRISEKACPPTTATVIQTSLSSVLGTSRFTSLQKKRTALEF